jgi:indole-3-glycerol phosphate synthase
MAGGGGALPHGTSHGVPAEPDGSVGLLERLVRESAEETASRRERVSLEELERRARARPAPLDFAAALRGEHLRVIAEMKARTPSAGVLADGDGYQPARLAYEYEAGGAAAISVICQEASFGGRPEHLAEAREACSLPLLRKDFVSEEYQVAEARALGADSVLLIVGAVPAPRLHELAVYCRRLGMEPLVEIHEQAQVQDALTVEARLIGVNHRDLNTFAVDTGLTERLRPLIPRTTVLVSESGVRDAAAARAVREAGADAVLVGEALMRAADPAALIRELAV